MTSRIGLGGEAWVDYWPAWLDRSEADRALALAQKICPVSGDELGGMGTPIKVSVNGRDVFLCCEGCKEDLLAEPEKYLAPVRLNSG